MGTIRVIVADTSGADLYDMAERATDDGSAPRAAARSARRADLQKVSTLPNVEAARHERDLGSGPPGRGMSRAAGARTALEPRSAHKQHVTERFARALARVVGAQARAPGVDGLVLVASPRFLATVKSHLPKATLARVLGEVRRNLVEAPRLSLQQHVRDCLPPPPIR